MKSLDVRVNEHLKERPGDFGTQVFFDHTHPDSEGFLEVSPNLWKLMEHAAMKPKTAEVLVCYIWTFPGAVRFAMGWTLQEVETARDSLCSQLRGLIDPRVLNPSTESSWTLKWVPGHS